MKRNRLIPAAAALLACSGFAMANSDLAVELSSDVGLLIVNGANEVTFTVNFENLGPDIATNLEIVFTAPPELDIINSSSGTIAGNTVTVLLNDLSVNGSGSVQIGALASSANPASVATAEISHAGPDPDPLNNTAEVTLLIADSPADFPKVDTIFTNIASQANSAVPGRSFEQFNNNPSGTLNSAFDRPFVSPDGSRWILRATTNASTTTSQVVLVGSGTQGQYAIGRGDPEPFAGGTRSLSNIDPSVSINDAGSWVIRTRDNGFFPDISHYVLKFDATTSEFSTPIRDGDQIPTLTDVFHGDSFIVPVIDNAGRVGVQSTNIQGTDVTGANNAALVLGDQLLLRKGVDGPTGLNVGPDATWLSFALNSFELDASGDTYLIRGNISEPSGNSGVMAIDNTAVIQNNVPIPGNTVLSGNPSAVIFATISGSGDWIARGFASGAEDRFVAHNGEVVGWLGGPTGLADGSVWDRTNFSQLFFGIAVNNIGDFAIGGWTDNDDIGRAKVFVLYCENGEAHEIIRSGDPVDLSGNGQLDDNAYMDQWQNDRVFLTETHLYFVAQVRDRFDAGGNIFGQGFFRVELPSCDGTTPCAPDLNGDGVVDADDFFLFLQLFAAGDPRADFNNDGVIDADDFFAFLNAFAAGC
ncbi:MAG: hypothetical protein JJU33_06845 [Phycisphaerales bacterium]|nr:hypothetical protein [Phycisphaerales bacterium]